MADVLKSGSYDIVSDSNIPFDMLSGSSVLVTGATGIIGSALLRGLGRYKTYLHFIKSND